MSKVFLRSVMCWQEAMRAAARQPHPFELFNGVDIEDAFGQLPEARKWLDRIGDIERGMTDMAKRCEDLGWDESAMAKYRSLLSELSAARRFAAEHVEVLVKRSAARAARRGPRESGT